MNLEEFEKLEKEVFQGNKSTAGHKNLSQLIEDLGDYYKEDEIRQILKETHEIEQKSISPFGPIVSKRVILTLLTAAAVVAIVFIQPVFFSPNSNVDNLYTAYYEQYPNLLLTRGTDSESILNNAGQEYNDRNFEEVYFLLKDVKSDKASFYRSLALMELEKTNEAVESWQYHLSHYDYLEHNAQFYLALSLMKIGQINESKEILKSLSADNNSTLSQKAKELLDSL